MATTRVSGWALGPDADLRFQVVSSCFKLFQVVATDCRGVVSEGGSHPTHEHFVELTPASGERLDIVIASVRAR